MSIFLSLFSFIVAKLNGKPGRLRADQRGTVAVMMAFLLPVLIGALGLGFEVSNWYLTKRAMQNAADSAAIAAASNNSSSYAQEANAVTARYGFVNGSNNVTVTTSNTATCPNDPNIIPPCYSVTISSVVPLYLSQVIGYKGNTTANGGLAELLKSEAIAYNDTVKLPICLLALDQSGTALTTNGAPNSDFSGCTVMSNSDATCNGSNLDAFYGLAAGTNTGCGNIQRSNVPVVSDPYEYMATNIPPDPCRSLYPTNSYPQETKHGGGVDPRNQLSGTLNLNGTLTNASGLSYAGQAFCGDVQLTSDVTINTGGVIVIYNGQLDLNGYTLKTADDSGGVTVVFAGTNGYNHIPSDNSSGQGGTLNIFAPSSSTAPFPGMALYQDPYQDNGSALTSNVDFSYYGNNPQWLISGGVYFPNADLTISGDVAQATDGADCFVMVADNILINGTSNIYQQTPDGSGCRDAGLAQPSVTINDRGKLVY